MPPVAAAVAVAVKAISIKAIVAKVALSIAVSVIMSKLFPPEKPKPVAIGDPGRRELVRQPVVARRVIYGRTKVSGPLVYAESYDIAGQSLAKNGFISMLVLLAGHECDAIESVWFDDVELELSGNEVLTNGYRRPGDNTACAWIYQHLGTADQVADAELVNRSDGKWTAAHRLRGITYIHEQLRYDRDVWATGAPTPRAIVRGKKIYDPRSDTTGWSDNPALCIRDYFVSYLGITAVEWNDDTVIAAANNCDESVVLAAGGTEKRYTLNGTVNLDESPAEVIEAMLSAMAGTLIYTGGQFEIYAGAASASVLSISDDDLAGSLRVAPRLSRKEIFNAVTPVFIDASQDYQETTAAPITNAAYVTQDGGQQIFKNLELPFTDSNPMSQRLGKIELERVRQQITLQTKLKPGVGLRVKAWDVISLTIARYGWSAKAFRIVSWKLDADLSVDVTLREEAAAMWSWSAEETVTDPAPDTNLTNPNSIAAPANVTLGSGNAGLVQGTDGSIVSRIRVSWDAVTNAYLDHYELQWRRSDNNPAVWDNEIHIQAGSTVAFASPVVDGDNYDVRIRAVNIRGIGSTWVEVLNHTVVGKTEKPPILTGLAAQDHFQGIYLTWTRPAVPDYSHVVIYSHDLDDRAGAAPIASISASAYLHKVGGGNTRYYWARVVDTSGNESDFNAIAGVTASAVLISQADIAAAQLTIAAFAQDIEPVGIVDALPDPATYGGRPAIVLLTTDLKLYRFDAAGPAWSRDVDGADIVANSIIAGTFAAGAVRANDVAANEIRGVHIAFNELVGDHLQVNQIVANHLTVASVTTPKVQDNGISVVYSAIGQTAINPAAWTTIASITVNLSSAWDAVLWGSVDLAATNFLSMSAISIRVLGANPDGQTRIHTRTWDSGAADFNGDGAGMCVARATGSGSTTLYLQIQGGITNPATVNISGLLTCIARMK